MAKKKENVETPADIVIEGDVVEGGTAATPTEGDAAGGDPTAILADVVQDVEEEPARVVLDEGPPEGYLLHVGLIPSLRFTDNLYIYQLDPLRQGDYRLRIVGVV